MIFILNNAIRHNGVIHPELISHKATPLFVNTDINKFKIRVDEFHGECVEHLFTFVVQVFGEDRCIEEFETNNYSEVRTIVSKLAGKYGENNES